MDLDLDISVIPAPPLGADLPWCDIICRSEISNHQFYRHVACTTWRDQGPVSISTCSWSAAAARWLLPATTTCGSDSSTWTGNSYLLPTYRTSTAASSAAGHHCGSSGDCGTDASSSVVRSPHYLVVRGVVLLLSHCAHCVHLGR